LDVLVSVIAARQAVALWHFGDRHPGPIGRLLDLQPVDLKVRTAPRPGRFRGESWESITARRQALATGNR
jgi:hypothetical protein